MPLVELIHSQPAVTFAMRDAFAAYTAHLKYVRENSDPTPDAIVDAELKARHRLVATVLEEAKRLESQAGYRSLFDELAKQAEALDRAAYPGDAPPPEPAGELSDAQAAELDALPSVAQARPLRTLADVLHEGELTPEGAIAALEPDAQWEAQPC